MEIDSTITRFGYIINKNTLPEETITKIKADLTIKPFKIGKFAKFAKDNSFPIYQENGDYISVPKYYGIEQFGQPKLDKIKKYQYPKYDMQYTGVLRPGQIIITDKIISGLESGGGGILVEGCGSGKTNMFIWLACKYKLKTLVVVHKEFLMNQVVNRITSNTNIKKVGIIQQKRVETDYPFVVGMVHSLCSDKYDNAIFKDFGMVIVDEVHHMGARNFSKFYQKISTKYMLGVSAERKRMDGAYKLINWYMGPFLHIGEQKPNDMVVVKKINYKTKNLERVKMINNKFTGEADISRMVTNLVRIKKRNRFIVKMVEELFDQGKNVLCLTGRIAHVEILYDLLNATPSINGNIGKYTGNMKKHELDASATKQIIIGTYSMAEEGLDIDGLNVVVMATPKTAVKQSVGRILRKEIYEEHPIVIDIVDVQNIKFNKQSQNRLAYFDKQDYNIQEFQVSENPEDNAIMWDDDKKIKELLVKLPSAQDKKDKNAKKKRANHIFAPVTPADIDILSSEE